MKKRFTEAQITFALRYEVLSVAVVEGRLQVAVCDPFEVLSTLSQKDPLARTNPVTEF